MLFYESVECGRLDAHAGLLEESQQSLLGVLPGFFLDGKIPGELLIQLLQHLI